MVSNRHLSKFIIKQFNIVNLQKLIKSFLNLVEQFQLMINDDEYQIRYSSTFEVKVGGNKKPTSSKVETLLFTEYDNMQKKKELLLKYKVGFNSLNEIERKVFKETFVDLLTRDEICENNNIYTGKYTAIKKSAIVKFCLATGLDHFVNIF